MPVAHTACLLLRRALASILRPVVVGEEQQAGPGTINLQDPRVNAALSALSRYLQLR